MGYNEYGHSDDRVLNYVRGKFNVGTYYLS